MMRVYILIILIGVCSNMLAFDFKQEVARLSNRSTKDFIQAFPFDKYLENYSIENVRILEAHKQYLNNLNIEGDKFIKEIIQISADSTAFSFDNVEEISQLLKLGDIFSKSRHYLDDSIMIYQAGGDFIFGNIAQALEKEIKEGKQSVDDFEIKYIIQRLIDNQYIIVIPTSNWSKLWRYAKEGRWDYIKHKFTSTYRNEFFMAIGFGVLFIMGMSWIFYKRKKKRRNLEIE